MLWIKLKIFRLWVVLVCATREKQSPWVSSKRSSNEMAINHRIYFISTLRADENFSNKIFDLIKKKFWSHLRAQLYDPISLIYYESYFVASRFIYRSICVLFNLSSISKKGSRKIHQCENHHN